MQEFDDILKQATQAVPEDYFIFPIDGGEAIYRERVYCYELYHQLRTRWPASCDYILNGEVDKRGHQMLAEFGADNAVPDFLVHRPGNNAMNHAIIEVKGPNLTYESGMKDLRKICRFMSSGTDYDRGIFLIYGEPRERNLEDLFNRWQSESFANSIELWFHCKPGQAAHLVDKLTPVKRISPCI